MTPRDLDLLRAVDVGEEAEAEAVGAGRVAEAVHRQRRLRRVERLADAVVQLVVGDAAPVLRLLVRHWLCVCGGRGEERGQASTCVYN